MKTDDPMHYARIPLRIAYCRDTDTLEIHNGERVHTNQVVAEGLTAHLDADGETAGFTLERARTLLMPHFCDYDAASIKLELRQQPILVSHSGFLESILKTQGKHDQGTLNIGYCQEYDILDLWNERGASFGWDVGANLTAFSKDAAGLELNGFTLEYAAKLLMPCFRQQPQT